MGKEQEKTNGACRRGLNLSMVVALLALIVSVVFGFGVTQNVSGLRQEVERVAQQGEVRAELDVVKTDVAALQKRLDSVSDFDAVARKAVLSATMLDLTQRLGVLAGTVDNDAYARKLNDAMKLMQEIQADLEK
ncbi:hypothetical protein LN040_00425 [Desulfovibrio subterraneus]|jgi:cell division protein FtsB|uniref:Uncharacterized protein n=1 Tax=Desulfovibrio subterraneus TaxID=2718620 RepID=A0A7J0BIF9_9BACT|nr:hypothetical protein [Desulfovibrio subterraneus]WBF67608.1 hypothetical protein LN040_00425 [Desulfovibrio subterraneus]GFM33439.1 hypothetical protein DSM101010T_18040 [Desulfovibrio subterraneus]